MGLGDCVQGHLKGWGNAGRDWGECVSGTRGIRVQRTEGIKGRQAVTRNFLLPLVL